MDKRTHIALVIIFTGVSVFFFNSFYREAGASFICGTVFLPLAAKTCL